MISRTDREMLKRNRKKPFAFWGLTIGIYSFFYGLFFIVNDGYLLAIAEPYLYFLPENIIGGILVIFGFMKVFGVFFHNDTCKLWGIRGLSAIWGSLWVIAVLYSFGTGRPNAVWLDRSIILALCLRISTVGDFGG